MSSPVQSPRPDNQVVPDIMKKQVIQGRGDRPRKEGRRDTGWIGAENVVEMIQKDSGKLVPDSGKPADSPFETGDWKGSPPVSPGKGLSSVFNRPAHKVSPLVRSAQLSPPMQQLRTASDLRKTQSMPMEDVRGKFPLAKDFLSSDQSDNWSTTSLYSNPSPDGAVFRATSGPFEMPTVSEETSQGSNHELEAPGGLGLVIDRFGADNRVNSPWIYIPLGFVAFFSTLSMWYNTSAVVALISMIIVLRWIRQRQLQRQNTT